MKKIEGLGNAALRAPGVTEQQCRMTAGEFDYLRDHPDQCPLHMKDVFEQNMVWWHRSQVAKRAVQTKRAKYTTWPTRRNDHEEK